MPTASASKVLGIGAALLAAAVVAYLAAARPSPGRGLLEKRFSSKDWTGQPLVERVVREPVLQHRDRNLESAEWTGVLVMPVEGLCEFGVEAEGEASVEVDGTSVVARPTEAVRGQVYGSRTLAQGRHPLRIRWKNTASHPYLRVFFHFMSGPHGWFTHPFTRDYVLPADVEPARPIPAGCRLAFWIAAMGLGLVGTSMLARGLALWRGGRVSSWPDLGLGLMVAAVGTVVRGLGVARADLHWDETAYWGAGRHFFRNLLVGDWSPSSFRWNTEHPPIAKWLYGLADHAAGPAGGKWFAAFMAGVTCLVLFRIGLRWVNRRVGLGAGLAFALLPYAVAHGRIMGLETPMALAVWAATYLLLVACERDSSWAHAGWAFVSVLGVGTRPSGVWFAGVALVAVVADAIRKRRIPWRATWSFAGAAAAVGVVWALWPWNWIELSQHFEAYSLHWGRFHPPKWVFGTFRLPPAWYYAFAFAVILPTGLTVAALVSLGHLAWRRTFFGLVVVASLALPFAQSLVSMRQDGARYVFQAIPAAALLAAMGVDLLASLAKRPWVRVAAQAALVLYLGVEIVRTEPYAIDYAAEWAGGPEGVARRRWLEIPFWGEGAVEALERVNALAPEGASVWLNVMPLDDVPGLRPDLVRRDSAEAQILVANRYQYGDLAQGYVPVHEVRIRGAFLYGVYRRPDVKLRTQPASAPPRWIDWR